MRSISLHIKKEIPGALGRTGILTTPHGDIKTPAFVAVGTRATVKGLNSEDLKALGAQVVLGNAYHLYLQPGEDVIAKAGGLADFMNWQGPTMTDSGGFQVFSLGFAYKKGVSKIAKESQTEAELEEIDSGENGQHSKLAKIDDDGVTFTSHLDGSIHRFTPESSIAIQEKIGADMIFVFDECTSPLVPRKYMIRALDRTHKWAKRCIEARRRDDQALFGIVQGGRYKDLRERSAKYIASLPFEGFGIGGSFDKDDMRQIVEVINKILPKEKPRHMLGIGEVVDIFEGVERGIDLFDCVIPTRVARHGILFTKNGKYDIKKSNNKDNFEPIVLGCGCYACKNHSKSYLHHLMRANEMLGHSLASIHNLYFMMKLMEDIRGSINNGIFSEFKKDFISYYLEKKDAI
ncbi:MAG: tRNA guanosine(34) transglycosylase Tgt [Patescibacteria group bacterium]